MNPYFSSSVDFLVGVTFRNKMLNQVLIQDNEFNLVVVVVRDRCPDHSLGDKIVTNVTLLVVFAVNRTFRAGEFDVLFLEERFHLGLCEV